VPVGASDDPEEKQIFRYLWKDETQREAVIERLKADREVRMRKPLGRRAKGMETYFSTNVLSI
jgi:hypothetical protein